jgi:hypothetical protein
MLEESEISVGGSSSKVIVSVSRGSVSFDVVGTVSLSSASPMFDPRITNDSVSVASNATGNCATNFDRLLLIVLIFLSYYCITCTSACKLLVLAFFHRRRRMRPSCMM